MRKIYTHCAHEIYLGKDEVTSDGAALVWLCVLPVNSYVEILIPKAMVLESEASGK